MKDQLEKDLAQIGNLNGFKLDVDKNLAEARVLARLLIIESRENPTTLQKSELARRITSQMYFLLVSGELFITAPRDDNFEDEITALIGIKKATQGILDAYMLRASIK